MSVKRRPSGSGERLGVVTECAGLVHLISGMCGRRGLTQVDEVRVVVRDPVLKLVAVAETVQ